MDVGLRTFLRTKDSISTLFRGRTAIQTSRQNGVFRAFAVNFQDPMSVRVVKVNHNGGNRVEFRPVRQAIRLIHFCRNRIALIKGRRITIVILRSATWRDVTVRVELFRRINSRQENHYLTIHANRARSPITADSLTWRAYALRRLRAVPPRVTGLQVIFKGNEDVSSRYLYQVNGIIKSRISVIFVIGNNSFVVRLLHRAKEDLIMATRLLSFQGRVTSRNARPGPTNPSGVSDHCIICVRVFLLIAVLYCGSAVFPPCLPWGGNVFFEGNCDFSYGELWLFSPRTVTFPTGDREFFFSVVLAVSSAVHSTL